jgi:hypothetical protein
MQTKFVDPTTQETQVALNIPKPPKDISRFVDPTAAKTIAKNTASTNYIDVIKGYAQSASDLVTGNDRKTAQTESLPEFTVEGLVRPYDKEKSFAGNVVGGMGDYLVDKLSTLTTFGDENQVKVLKARFPELRFSEDEKGNILVDGSYYGQAPSVLNLPGVSKTDLIQAGFQVAAFSPAAKTARLGYNLVTKAVPVALASGATQTAQDLTSQALGREEEPSLMKVDGDNVALATIGGGVYEVLSHALSPVWSSIKNKLNIFRKTGVLDGATKETIQKEAVKLGIPADEVTDDFISSFAKAADEAADPDQIRGLQSKNEFNLKGTKGQVLNNTKQLELEDSLREGVFGSKAKDKMIKFRDEHINPSINQARKNVSNKIAGKDIVEDSHQSSNLVTQSIKDNADDLERRISGAYESIGEARLSPEGFKELLSATKKSLRGIEFDRSLDQSNKVLQEIGNFEKLIKSAGVKLKPAHIKTIDQLRRRLGTAIGAAKDASDKRQVTIMKARFDEYLDDAIIKGMFDGDGNALEALKQARSLRAEYAKKFQMKKIKGKSTNIVDPSGKFLEKVVAANPTSDEFNNFLFSSSRTFGNKNSAEFVKRIRGIVGEDSDAWQSIRQAGFLKLTQPAKGQDVVSGARFSSSLDDALTKNKEFLTELYTPDEISMFQRLAAAIKQRQPDRLNPSGTAPKAASIIRQMAERFALIDPQTYAAVKGASFLSSVRGSAKAQAAMNARPLKDISPGVVSGATGATVQTFN